MTSELITGRNLTLADIVILSQSEKEIDSFMEVAISKEKTLKSSGFCYDPKSLAKAHESSKSGESYFSDEEIQKMALLAQQCYSKFIQTLTPAQS